MAAAITLGVKVIMAKNTREGSDDRVIPDGIRLKLLGEMTK